MSSLDLQQTLAITTVENFLTEGELAAVWSALDADPVVAEARRNGDGGPGLHDVPGLSADEIRATFEPHGRFEVTTLPDQVSSIADDAVDRVMPVLRQVFPAATAVRPWTYVEYGPQQSITTHVDGIAPSPTTWPRQVAGIAITIRSADEGGEFYVETSSDQQLWDPESGSDDLPWAREGSDHSSSWFRAMRRTRWVVSPGIGTLTCYGSQLAHGTLPVRRGRAAKLLSWLIYTTSNAEGQAATEKGRTR